jgi:tetratricopeptide (TPR) repeat protein
MLKHFSMPTSVPGSRSIQKWIETFDEALEQRNYGLCAALLDVRNELRIVNNFQRARVAQSEGQYYAVLNLYGEAEQAYKEALLSYDAELQQVPNDVAPLNNKGNVLQSLGSVLPAPARTPEAIQNIQQAIQTYEATLIHSPYNAEVLINMGIALVRLCELATIQAHNANELLQVSIRALQLYLDALAHRPAYINTIANKTNVMQSLSNVLNALPIDLQALPVPENSLTHTLDYMNALRSTAEQAVVSRLHTLQAAVTRAIPSVENIEADYYGILNYREGILAREEQAGVVLTERSKDTKVSIPESFRRWFILAYTQGEVTNFTVINGEFYVVSEVSAVGAIEKIRIETHWMQLAELFPVYELQARRDREFQNLQQQLDILEPIKLIKDSAPDMIRKILEDEEIRAILCAALKSGTNTTEKIVTQIIPVLVTARFVEILILPIHALLLASLGLTLIHMGVRGVCGDYLENVRDNDP